MNFAKKTLTRTKQFVVEHKVPIAIVTTAATTIAVMSKVTAGALNTHLEFLDEKNLTDEYLQWIVDNANV